MSIEGQDHFLLYIFQVLHVLGVTRPSYQVSVYRTIGPLVLKKVEEILTIKNKNDPYYEGNYFNK